MLIGVLADTHDRLPMIDAALGLFARRRVGALIHPGDYVAPFAIQRLKRFAGPIHATFGNNDGERAGLKAVLPQLTDGPLFVESDGRAILVHHFADWCEPADVKRADIVVTGHTHKADVRISQRTLFVNPGECCGWVTGRCSIAIINTDGPSAEIIDLLPR
ncbi:MAG: metallophosphoesterase [Phycisphaerales bacterium]|nr:MAG: metallophosphoesterase [Phycisphaerales bacterium]